MFKTVKKGQKNPKKSFLLFVGITIIIALAGFLIFSVYSYQSSEQEKEGFFTCSQDGKICELSQHIHAQVEINVCGEKITLPASTFPLCFNGKLYFTIQPIISQA